MVLPSRGLLRSDDTPLQSGLLRSPASSRFPTLPKPRPRLRGAHPRTEARTCTPVGDRNPVQVGDPPEGVPPVTSQRLGSLSRSCPPPKQLAVRSGSPLRTGGHRFPGCPTESVIASHPALRAFAFRASGKVRWLGAVCKRDAFFLFAVYECFSRRRRMHDGMRLH